VLGIKLLLRLESNSSGKCAKLHTAAASNNKDRTLAQLLLVHTTYIYGKWALFFANILFMVYHAFNAMLIGEVATTSSPLYNKLHFTRSSCEGCI